MSGAGPSSSPRAVALSASGVVATGVFVALAVRADSEAPHASPIPVSVAYADDAAADQETETALFYVCCEALANAVKHARATGSAPALLMFPIQYFGVVNRRSDHQVLSSIVGAIAFGAFFGLGMLPSQHGRAGRPADGAVSLCGMAEPVVTSCACRGTGSWSRSRPRTWPVDAEGMPR